jgi:hypothetical protein
VLFSAAFVSRATKAAFSFGGGRAQFRLGGISPESASADEGFEGDSLMALLWVRC